MKTYGDCTFPAGTYEALRVCIGKAKGRNWWCVLYPGLCFADSVNVIVPDEKKQELKTFSPKKNTKVCLTGGKMIIRSDPDF